MNPIEIISNTDSYNKDIMVLPNLVGKEGERENWIQRGSATLKKITLWTGEGQDLALMNNVNWVVSETAELWGKKAFVIVTNYLIFLCYSDINSAHVATFVLTI